MRTSASRTADDGPRRAASTAARTGTATRVADDRYRRRPDRRAQDVQAVHRRRVPALRDPDARTWSAPPTARRSPTPVARRARTSATRSAPPHKAGPGWAAKTAMNRGQVLYRVAELMEGRRDQFIAEVVGRRGAPRAARRRRRRPGDRPLGLVRRLGRQDHPDPGPQQPGGRAVLQLHDPRADRRRRRRRARDLVAAGPGSRLAPPLVSGNASCWSRPRPGRCRRSP